LVVALTYVKSYILHQFEGRTGVICEP